MELLQISGMNVSIRYKPRSSEDCPESGVYQMCHQTNNENTDYSFLLDITCRIGYSIADVISVCRCVIINDKPITINNNKKYYKHP